MNEKGEETVKDSLAAGLQALAAVVQKVLQHVFVWRAARDLQGMCWRWARIDEGVPVQHEHVGAAALRQSSYFLVG